MFPQSKQAEIMHLVLAETKKAIANGDNPFAAALVDSVGNVILTTHNSQNSLDDRTAHAEVVLVRNACRQLHQFYLTGYSVFQVSEPCSMCTSLLIKAKIDAIYFGAPLDQGNDPYIRAVDIVKQAKHQPQIYSGILEKECRELIELVRKF